MGLAKRSKAFYLISTCFCIGLAIADPLAYQLYKRQDPTTAPSTTELSIPTTEVPLSITVQSSATPTESKFEDNGIKSTTEDISAAPTTVSSVSKSSILPTAVKSAINGVPTSLLNYTGYNYELTPDVLPLSPQVTPGFAVSGIILLMSGTVYTLIGIKNKWLHISLSAGYLAGVSVTVLILYVMNPPVSNAVQGAYVVAAILTGAILAGASLVFTEMTEGLGCLLGGFCLGMWLLVLKPGGLLKGPSKPIFIAAFTVAGFATSFSHHIRPYASIGFISFSGATVMILGIDCFTRAGLKEFWAYLWDLNPNLFPLGATSYPLTRGMRVEIALIVVIFLAGIVSQLKVWKIIRERRKQRVAEQIRDERSNEEEEQMVGRRIENENAQARGQWEAVYGDKDTSTTRIAERDSGLGDMDCSKKLKFGLRNSVERPGEKEIENQIEMSQMQCPNAGMVIMRDPDGGPVTVRVTTDNEHPREIHEYYSNNESGRRYSQLSGDSGLEKTSVVSTDGQVRLEIGSRKRGFSFNAKRIPTPAPSPVPEIVPLPFKIPGDMELSDDRSSIATVATDEALDRGKRRSKTLSAGSMLMRKMSKLSQRSSKSRRVSLRQRSSEDLMSPPEAEDDRASSLVATLDCLSDDEDVNSTRSSIKQIPYEEEPAGRPCTPGFFPPELQVIIATPESAKNDSPSELSSERNCEQLPTPRSLTASTDPKTDTRSESTKRTSEESEKPSRSVVSTVLSQSQSLSKDVLPAQPSRVVTSYRTNEWAKHLSNADSPDLEELKLAEYPPETEKERVAPVNVEELQKTADNSLPLPAVRSVSNASYYPKVTRSNSAMSQYSQIETANANTHDNTLSRTFSQQSLSNAQLVLRSSSTPVSWQAIPQSPIESTSPGLNSKQPRRGKAPPLAHQNSIGGASTLIGKRGTMLKNKGLYGSNADFYNSQISRKGSDLGNAYNCHLDDEDMPLSARRNIIRRSSPQLFSYSSPSQSSTPPPPQVQLPSTAIPFDSHQPQREPCVPNPLVRDLKLASWRASVQQELQSTVQPCERIEQQRSMLWEGRKQEEMKKSLEDKKRGEREDVWDERMRSGQMLDAHREALRKMQESANRII